MSEKKSSKTGKYISNILLGIIILILIVPSWRIKFQSTIQGFFLKKIEIESLSSQPFNGNLDNWVIYNEKEEAIPISNFDGQPLIVNFWATWCPPCLAELPDLHLFYEKMKGKAIIVAISTESYETILNAGLMEKYPGLLYHAKAIPKALDFSAYPTTFIINKERTDYKKIEGAQNFNHPSNILYIEQLNK
ncbi:hypothetical protein DNU06_07700 [Putridiphycobacter roseus]|uniref:Thioredoxin domain-containing protein n=1 Tax=Putridiphycobacter roseus TaxID=2219161 RepID=A0A2W1NE56_9FLAO|nr:TlpA disulfide reductase family protein [Putridiphycobacter roseus]PZE17705.1 hypothetical protein DNU06_07700 [Putridiphycobacter roseus]